MLEICRFTLGCQLTARSRFHENRGGGKFEHGFYAGAFAAAFSQYIDGLGDNNMEGRATRVIASAIVGGTAEELGGGKFANGAVSGAFVQLFNGEPHRQQHDPEVLEYMREIDEGIVSLGAVQDAVLMGPAYLGVKASVHAYRSILTSGVLSNELSSSFAIKQTKSNDGFVIVNSSTKAGMFRFQKHTHMYKGKMTPHININKWHIPLRFK